MKVGVIDTNRDRFLEVCDLLKNSRFECVAFDVDVQGNEDVNTRHFDIIIIRSPEFSSSVLTLAQNFRRRCGVDIAIVYIASQIEYFEELIAIKAGIDLCIRGSICRATILTCLDMLATRLVINSAKAGGTLHLGNYQVDLVSRAVMVNGCAVDLSEREFNLVGFLFANIGRIVSRCDIERAIWGKLLSPSRSLDAYLSRIRKKMVFCRDNGVVLKTIYGKGYKLDLAGNID